MVTSTSPQHILLCSAHMWGHTRAFAILSARMVKLRPVTISFFVAAKMYDRTKAEILSDISLDEPEPLSRICLPLMYDYELEPQALPFPPDMCARIWVKLGRMLRQTDGIVTMDAAAYHPTATRAMRDWYAETGRKVYYAGPLITSAQQPTSPSLLAGQSSNDIKGFLGRMLAEHGENSVVLVSFGSMLWPLDSTKLLAALEVLMEEKIAFLMTRPSLFAEIPDACLAKIKAYKDALIADWVPQFAVLEHPATGWCLTHGGHNSVLECIYTGVPMIVWPIAADQEPNAVHLTDHLNVAYELLEVRNGTGLGTIFRTGRKPTGTVDAVRSELKDVLARAFGVDGEAKRKRLLDMRAKLRTAWAETEGEGDGVAGIAKKEVENFLDGHMHAHGA